MRLLQKQLILIGILLGGLTSCQEEPIKLDYCQMIAEDQSFVNPDKSDMDQFNADRAKRRVLIINNFELLMRKTKQTGLPYVSIGGDSSQTCKHRAVTMTMLHAAQSIPEKFFGKKYAAIFQQEVEKGNLEPELLKISSLLTANTINLCEQLKPEIKAALKLWGLDPAIFANATFVECE